ncbi:MAG: hypothetical protein ABIH82_04015 [Candidatus Woesearchaeota archaeon]
MDKRGSLTLSFVVIVLAIILLSTFLVGMASRECNNNSDCQDDSYCGADNSCHRYPDKVLVKQNNFVPAALVFGIAIIIAAFIYRKKDLF